MGRLSWLTAALFLLLELFNILRLYDNEIRRMHRLFCTFKRLSNYMLVIHSLILIQFLDQH